MILWRLLGWLAVAPWIAALSIYTALTEEEWDGLSEDARGHLMACEELFENNSQLQYDVPRRWDLEAFGEFAKVIRGLNGLVIECISHPERVSQARLSAPTSWRATQLFPLGKALMYLLGMQKGGYRYLQLSRIQPTSVEAAVLFMLVKGHFGGLVDTVEAVLHLNEQGAVMDKARRRWLRGRHDVLTQVRAVEELISGIQTPQKGFNTLCVLTELPEDLFLYICEHLEDCARSFKAAFPLLIVSGRELMGRGEVERGFLRRLDGIIEQLREKFPERYIPREGMIEELVGHCYACLKLERINLELELTGAYVEEDAEQQSRPLDTPRRSTRIMRRSQSADWTQRGLEKIRKVIGAINRAVYIDEIVGVNGRRLTELNAALQSIAEILLSKVKGLGEMESRPLEKWKQTLYEILQGFQHIMQHAQSKGWGIKMSRLILELFGEGVQSFLVSAKLFLATASDTLKVTLDLYEPFSFLQPDNCYRCWSSG